MRKVFDESNLERRADVNQAVRKLISGKPYLRFNADLQICGCNDSFIQIFKIGRNKLLATNLTGYIQNKQFVEAVRKAIKEGITTYHGKVLLGAGLSEVYLEAFLFTAESGNADESGVFCYILDGVFSATEKKIIAGGFNSETELPSNLYASVHTPDGTAIYISPSIETLLGYTSEEIKQLGSLNLIYPDDLQIVKKALEKLNNGADFLTTMYRMVHKNGSVVFVETTSYILGEASGTTNHIVNVTWDLSSQQGIQHALQISEQKYYRLVMNLPVGVSLISADGQLLEVNNTMKKIMRIPHDFPILELNFLRIEGMVRSGLSVQFSRCVEAKEEVNGEIQIKLSRKTKLSHLTYSFIPILDHYGEVESVIGYVNDLTKQKKAESDYHQQVDFLNLVINTIKTPFFVKDEDHKWVVLNDAAVEMMGQTREALLWKSDYDLYPKEQAEIFWKNDELVFKSGNNSNEEQITWSDGTLHTIVTHKQLYIEKPSGKKFIVGTIHDITSYKQIEEELRASETKYRELFDNATDFIITTDINGKITNANRTLLRYLETDLESLMKRNVFEFIRDESIGFAHFIKTKMTAEGSVQSFELKAYGVSGEPVVYEVKAGLIRQNGEPAGVHCVFSDVTTRTEASLKLEKYNASLIELNKTKDKFFSIIAHDLRNPYTSMIGYTEMLLEDLDELSKDEIRDSLKIIHGSVKNSLNLLENLLAWSRLQTGHMPFNPIQLGLSDVVEDVVNVLFSLAYRKKIGIVNQVDADILLFADKNMLVTILNNLVMNAIKFSNIGGEIIISAGINSSGSEKDREFVTISVADTGVGMDTETCDKLFTSNRLPSSPGTAREQGSGLGLLLTREMVEKHDGLITVESTLGKGTVFSFLIPVYKPATDTK
jgi:PAS domain S-box-containing protein